MVNLWKFRTRNFKVTLDCEYESYPDLSWDDTGEVQEKLASGEWGNYVFRVAVYGPIGELLAFDYLGNSIYADPADFRDHIGAAGKYGSYFTDMVHSVISDARKALAASQSVYVRLAALPD